MIRISKVSLLDEKSINKEFYDYLFNHRSYKRRQFKNSKIDLCFTLADAPPDGVYKSHKTLWKEAGVPNPKGKLKVSKDTIFCQIDDKKLDDLENSSTVEIEFFLDRSFIKDAIEKLSNEDQKVIDFYSEDDNNETYLSYHSKDTAYTSKRRAVKHLVNMIFDIQKGGYDGDRN